VGGQRKIWWGGFLCDDGWDGRGPDSLAGATNDHRRAFKFSNAFSLLLSFGTKKKESRINESQNHKLILKHLCIRIKIFSISPNTYSLKPVAAMKMLLLWPMC
jgi:hypothetical protein